MKVDNADFQRADALQQALLEGSANAHSFAGGLHLGAEAVIGIGELIKGEPGHFGNDIVQSRFKSRTGVGQGNFIQRHTHADFGRNPGDRIAAGLGGQCGAAGNSGVYFDQIVLEGVRIQRELHVAAALNLQRPDQLQSGVPEHMIFLVGQGLRGAHDNGVTGVDAHRIQILHVADGDGGVVGIAHDLIFDFFEALDALFHKNLMNRGEDKGIFHDLPELFLVISEATACTAQGKSGAQNYRVADLCRCVQAFLHGIGN